MCSAAPTQDAAQLLGRGGLGSLVPPLSNPLGGVSAGVTSVTDAAGRALAAARLDRLKVMARAHPDLLELDDRGDLIVRGTVLALGASSGTADRARAEGFAVDRADPGEGLDLHALVLRAPPGVSTRDALRRLRGLDPQATFDVDPIYAPSAAGPVAPTPHREQLNGPPAAAGNLTVGLVDTGVEASHPAFAGVRLVGEGFASGGFSPAPHGTETASILVGSTRAGGTPASATTVFAADVFGASPAGGSGDLVVRGLAWVAARGARVINVSLVGPPNALMAAAVRALAERGVTVVAPVGNDGPAAPPAYPASYPQVVSVTGVDPRGRVLIEAGHASHLDFAAPGADVEAARLGGGVEKVRGTSFAAPAVAAALAREEATGLSPPAAVAALARHARKGSGYGRGLIADGRDGR